MKTSIKWLWYQCWKVTYFTRDHINTYLWWNRSPNYRILFFTCFTNSSRSPLWNTSKSQEKLLESLLIFTLQILENNRWCPREIAYFERVLKNYIYIYIFTHCISLINLTDVGVFIFFLLKFMVFLSQKKKMIYIIRRIYYYTNIKNFNIQSIVRQYIA